MIENSFNYIIDLVRNHEEWRNSCLNFVAAENVSSPQVRQFALTDLVGRYGDYLGRDIDNRKYLGTEFIVKIEKEVVKLAQNVFNVKHVEFRPLSGHVAGAAVIMGLTKPGDTVLEVGSNCGGHRLGEKLTHANLIDLNVQFLPVDGHAYNLDVGQSAVMIEELCPSLIILGSSNFLFPHPVAEIAEALYKVNPKAVLAYDASHVLGLIAGGAFQDPLGEGADLVFGSTHKTLPGPQGGLIISNSVEIIDRVSEACYPGLITNHHLSRSPALAIALLEMMKFGKEYAHAVIQNAKSLGAALEQNGLAVVGADRGYTESHTVLVETSSWGNNKEIAKNLEYCNIIVNPVMLPEEYGGEGLRLGVQELTRRGASTEMMEDAAVLIAEIIQSKSSLDKARKRAKRLAQSLSGLQFVLSG